MTSVLTTNSPTQWLALAEPVNLESPATANAIPLRLGGMWKGYEIKAVDIQEARKELWSEIESAE